MRKNILGITLLAFALLFTLQACQSHRRAYYRDGFAPAYVNVRVVRPHRVIVPRAYGPSYRVRHYNYSNDGRHYRKFKDNRHDKRHGRGHR
jgi:hypothetical protein